MLKVKDLIEQLQSMDPDANVHVMVSQNQPVEHVCVAVKQRKDFSDWVSEDQGRYATDVFLMQGSVIRPGNKKAWE